jgi:hypothetical protein
MNKFQSRDKERGYVYTPKKMGEKNDPNGPPSKNSEKKLIDKDQWMDSDAELEIKRAFIRY